MRNPTPATTPATIGCALNSSYILWENSIDVGTQSRDSASNLIFLITRYFA